MRSREKGGVRQALGALVWGVVLAILSRFPARITRAETRRNRLDRLLEFGTVFGVLTLAGLLVVVLGLVPIRASSGHWAITKWFLDFAKQRSVSTYSMRTTVPRLDDPALVLKGAGQFETSCRPCHGAPDLRFPRVAASMLPAPPDLGIAVGEWTPAELFTIVKHGIKFTGMPAWPALHRDDEVWATVAFLRILPRLNADEYRLLVTGRAPGYEAAAPIAEITGSEKGVREVEERCARCHGLDGRGRGIGAFPRLAGQHAAYLFHSLRAYADGRRQSGVMAPVARGMTEREMREFATYYAGLDPAVGTHGESGDLPVDSADTGAVARGRIIAHRGIPSQKVPACVECHGPTEPHPRSEYPMLAGQYPEYLRLQLELFAAGHRGGSAWSHLMHEVGPRLTAEQRRDVAAYYGSLTRK